RSCLALHGSASGSGLRSPYASSPMHQAVSCSTLFYLWTGSSSPVASHPAFRRRSFLRLRTASVLSDGDFHPIVGAHSQAHAGAAAGGLTLLGALMAGGCFLIGCCGSPMLAVYLSLFGAKALGLGKPLM